MFVGPGSRLTVAARSWKFVKMRPSATEDPARRAEIGLCVLLAAADGDVSEREIGCPRQLSNRLFVHLRPPS